MIILILLLAFGLRLVAINQSFWLDEAITATIARDLNLGQIIANYLPLDNSPPVYILLINSLFAIVGPNELADRLLSVLFGVGVVFVIYKIAKELKNETFAIMAALLAATSPLLIYYSQEGRMYALTAFLASAVMYFFIKFWKKSNVLYLVGYTFFGIILVYTHYVPSIILVVTNLLAVIFKKINRWWIVAQGLIILAFTLWLPIFSKQLILGISGRGKSELFDEVLGKFSAKSVPVSFEKFVLGRIPIDNNWTIIPVLIAVLFFAYLLAKSFLSLKGDLKKIFGIWLGVPLILVSVISLKIPVFQYYRILFLIVPFYLLIILGVERFGVKIRLTMFICLIVVNLIAASLYFTRPMFQREQWRQAITWVVGNLKEGDLVVFGSGEPFAPYLWYRPVHPEAKGAFLGFYASDQSEDYFMKLTTGKKRLIVFTYLQDITDPQRLLQRWIHKEGFEYKGSKEFLGVGGIETYEH